MTAACRRARQLWLDHVRVPLCLAGLAGCGCWPHRHGVVDAPWLQVDWPDQLTAAPPRTVGRHRVYFPGPHSRSHPEVHDHPPGCDPDGCPVDEAMLSAWRRAGPFAAQGDYFTEDGLDFVRCSWQPSPESRRAVRERLTP